MPVARLRVELSNDEYVRWSMYFALKAQRLELARLTGGARRG